MNRPIESEHVLSGGIFDVERCRWTTSSGDRVDRMVIRHPGAVTIVPVCGDGSIVLVGNARIAVGDRLWELPAGKLEPGEPPRETALRELSEETGYRASSITDLGWFFTSPGFCDERMHCFLAEGLTSGVAHPEPGEDLEVGCFDQETIWRMIDEGEIVDGKSLAALLLWQRRGVA